MKFYEVKYAYRTVKTVGRGEYLEREDFSEGNLSTYDGYIEESELHEVINAYESGMDESDYLCGRVHVGSGYMSRIRIVQILGLTDKPSGRALVSNARGERMNERLREEKKVRQLANS